MINTSKAHPLFDKVLSDFFSTQAPAESPLANVKLQPRKYRNEDYYEYHESRDDLHEVYNNHGRRNF